MTILQYIRDYLPKHLNVHPAFGKVAELVFNSERINNPAFSNDKFESLRERAELGIPYQINNLDERERILNILEIILCKHRQEMHGENYNNRIKKLLIDTNITEDEYNMIMKPKGFWSG